MEKKEKFDILIKSDIKIPEIQINNLAELLFNKIPERNENSVIIISHLDEKLVEISLFKLRYIVSKVYEELEKKDIKQGDTVLLATLFVNNELLTALMLTALTSFGCRVIFPMFIETSEIRKWIEITGVKSIIIPKSEIKNSENKFEREKSIIDEIIEIAKDKKIRLYDIFKDFNIIDFLKEKIPQNFNYTEQKLVKKAIKNTNHSTESIIFTTSGTTGRSKLVVYEQVGFLTNCYSWKESGLYSSDKLGAKSFIDIFPHTVSVRAFFNAIFTGFPICIVTSDWIKNQPVKLMPLMIKMKPEVVTLGPSSMEFVLESVKLLPVIKDSVFPNLKTVVSTGANYSVKTADILKEYFGLPLHNAFGTSETQQVLNTLLSKEKINKKKISLGSPLVGIEIGLKKFDEDLFKLYIKSPFGHKYCIDLDSEEKIYPDTFFYTGDLVKIDEKNNIFYSGRENKDYFKNGFGAKVPISFMKKAYENLYKEVCHIEYYPSKSSELTYGIAALIFIKENKLEAGVVKDKDIISKYSELIININNQLKKTIEPFEYEHRTIKKLLLINDEIPQTKKKTVSKYLIDKNYEEQIELLKYSNDLGSGVSNIITSEDRYICKFKNLSLIKISIFRKIYAKIITFKCK